VHARRVNDGVYPTYECIGKILQITTERLLSLLTRTSEMTGSSKRILFVDDEKFQRESMKDILMMLGYDVELAKSGAEALEISHKEAFPLIITDLSMPEMDGTQLCRQIRERNGTAVIYAFSGYLAEVAADQLKEAGFDGHLCKPANIEILKHAIEGAFEKNYHRRSRTMKPHS
jgi:CheY-like chemotaxis protein